MLGSLPRLYEILDPQMLRLAQIPGLKKIQKVEGREKSKDKMLPKERMLRGPQHVLLCSNTPSTPFIFFACCHRGICLVLDSLKVMGFGQDINCSLGLTTQKGEAQSSRL